jgi:CrcB protein
MIQGDWMVRLLIVGMGGFLGTVFRFMLVEWVHKLLNDPWYPYGTFAVNVLGCLLIGFLGGLAENKGLLGSEMRLFFVIGLLGGFTTFSAFGYETHAFFKDTQVLAAMMNIMSHVVLGIGAVFLGYRISNFI